MRLFTALSIFWRSSRRSAWSVTSKYFRMNSCTRTRLHVSSSKTRVPSALWPSAMPRRSKPS